MQKSGLLLLIFMWYVATAASAQTTFALTGGLDGMWTNEQKGGVHFTYTYGIRDRDKPYLRLGPSLGFTAAHPITKFTQLRALLNYSLLHIGIGPKGTGYPARNYQSSYYSLQVAIEQSIINRFLIGMGLTVRFMPTERYGLNSKYYQEGQIISNEPTSPDIEYFYQPGKDMVRRVDSRTIGLTATVGYIVSPRGQVVLSHFYPLKETFTYPTHIPELSVTRLAVRYRLGKKDK